MVEVREEYNYIGNILYAGNGAKVDLIEPLRQQTHWPMHTRGSLTLATYLWPMLELECRKCGRMGRYRREALVDCFGPDMTLPELLQTLANCPKASNMADPCQAVYVGLGE